MEHGVDVHVGSCSMHMNRSTLWSGRRCSRVLILVPRIALGGSELMRRRSVGNCNIPANFEDD
eukprot:3279283-Amphidinium_carterae.1